jgi:hypothetical protein
MDLWMKLRPKLDKAHFKQLEQFSMEAHHHGINHVTFCEKAFRALLWSHHSELKWEHVLEFLLNPQLNAPEARHMTYLISQLGRRLLSVQEFEATKHLLEGCAKLGLISDEELPELIGAIFETVRYLTKSIMVNDAAVGASDSAESLIEALWRGMKACTIKEIPPHVAELILSEMPRSRSLHAFRFDLYQHAFPVDGAQDAPRRMERCLTTWITEACGLSSTSRMNVTILADLLEDLYPTLITEGILVTATHQICDKFRMPEDIDVAHDRDTVLNGWLICLQNALAYRVWNRVLHVLHKEVSPIDLIPFFSRLQPSYLICEALLLHWIPSLPYMRVRADMLRARSLTYDTSKTEHDYKEKFKASVMNKTLTDLRYLHQQGRSPHTYDMFAYLLIALSRHHQLTFVNEALILHFCEKLFGTAALAEVCDHARSAGVWLAAGVIHPVINNVFQQEPQVALSLWKSRMVRTTGMPGFLKALIEDETPSLEIFKILAYYDPAAVIPREERVDKRSLTWERIDLLHECAEAFSKQKKVTHRVRFRNVHLCYRYLAIRGAPMTPTMSRALVKAGITDYLAEGVNVSKAQVKWIVEMVAKIEGEEVAKQLDELAWGWMQRVYADRNKRGIHRRPQQIKGPPAKLRRGRDGLPIGMHKFGKMRAEGAYARRTRWYLPDGTVKHTDLDGMFGKRVNINIRKKMNPRVGFKKAKGEEAWKPPQASLKELRNQTDGELESPEKVEWEEDDRSITYQPGQAVARTITIDR